MLKKTLLSLAIASSTIGLTACNISSISGNNKVDDTPVKGGNAPTSPIFSAALKTLPLMNDLIFLDASITDGTASAGDSVPPVTTALNSIAGSSTVAPIDIEFTAGLDVASLQELYSVNLIKLRNAKDDPSIDASDLLGSIIPVSESLGVSPTDDPVQQPVLNEDYSVSFFTLNDGKTPNLRISLINPLDAKTKYLVVLTNKIKDSKGDAVVSSSEYSLVTGDLGLPSALLEPVRDELKGGEIIAGRYLAELSENAVVEDDIILSYAFTTGGTSDVLIGIAAPEIFAMQLASNPATAEPFFFNATKNTALDNGQDEENANATAAAAVLDVVVGSAADDAFADSDNPTSAEIAAVKATDAYKDAIVAAAKDPQIITFVTSTLATPKAQQIDFIMDAAYTPEAPENPEITIDNIQEFVGDTGALGDTGGTGEIYRVSTLGITTPQEIGVAFIQGQIELPVGFGAPTLTNAEALASGDADTIAAAVKLSYATDSVWAADDALNPPSDNRKYDPVAGRLTTEGVTEIKDADGNITGYSGGMTNVTYRYPLADLNQTEYAPVMMTVPSRLDYSAPQIGGRNCALPEFNPFPVIIYAHAVTADRVSSVGLGTKMAINCFVTIAIDLPLHGVAPVSDSRDGIAGENIFFGFNVERAEQFDYTDIASAGGGGQHDFAKNAQDAATNGTTFANLEERHRNLASQLGTNGRVAMDVTRADGTDETPILGKSGDFFFNIGNLGRLRDNIRQGVVDLMHLNASLGTIDMNGDGNPDLDTTKVYVAGSSLGAMVGAAFVAVNNQADVQAKNPNLPKIQGVVLANPGGSLPKMLENSPAITARIFGGLNLTQDASNLQKYQTVLQAALNSADTINFADLLRNDDTPVLMYSMIGGGDCPAYNAETGTCSDVSNRIPASIIKSFGGVYPPDHVFPNDDYFKSAETNPYVNVLPTLSYELNGTTTFLQHNESSGAPLTGTTPLAQQMGLTLIGKNDIPATLSSNKVYMPFEKGSHVTFITSDDQAAFNSMMEHMVSFFSTNGEELNQEPEFNNGIATEQAGYAPVQGGNQ
jgi:pimeloyl-ACP methyl ester carboxylesterase